MFRGRISIDEIMNLPNRVYIGLLNMKHSELNKSENSKDTTSNSVNPVQAQLMEEELEDMMIGGI